MSSAAADATEKPYTDGHRILKGERHWRGRFVNRREDSAPALACADFTVSGELDVAFTLRLAAFVMRTARPAAARRRNCRIQGMIDGLEEAVRFSLTQARPQNASPMRVRPCRSVRTTKRL